MKTDDRLKKEFKAILDASGYEISINDYEKLDIKSKPSRHTLSKRFGNKSWEELKEMVAPELKDVSNKY